MNTLYFCTKVLRFLTAKVIILFLIITPLIFSSIPEMGEKNVPNMKSQRAFAVANVGILQNQNLKVSYNSSTGNLSLGITGTPLVGLGLLNTQNFVYQLPEELKFILDDSRFQDHAKIDFRAPFLLIGNIKETINGSSLVLDSVDGTITGSRTSVLDLSLLRSVTVTLSINLKALDVTSLPSSSDGFLQFYGIVANEAIIDINLLTSEGSLFQMETGILPPEPPAVNPVTDVDTVVTGTGVPGATIHIMTPDDSFEGMADETGFFNIEIPVQEVGTEIVVSQTNPSGIQSEQTSVIVIGVILDLTVPSKIPFKNTLIAFHEVTIKREEPILSVTVRDTRGQGSNWRIKAKATEPLTSIDGHKLDPNVLVYVSGNNVKSLIEEVLIYEGATGIEKETTIQWNENEGILIKMTPMILSEVQADVEYSTIINWTLENAP